MKKQISPLVAITAIAFLPAPMIMGATSIGFLDFGGTSEPTFGKAGGTNVIQYTNVITGVNATLTSNSGLFTSKEQSKNGATGGDGRLNVGDLNITNNEVVDLTLALWDSGSGSGFDVAFDNGGVSFCWDIVFYDLDSQVDKAFDQVAIDATQSFYTTSDTRLSNEVIGSLRYFNTAFPDDSSLGGGGVTTPDGTSSLTPDQARSSFGLTITDTNVLNFQAISVISENSSNGRGNGRNILFDGGQLSADIVPEPSAVLLSLVGMAGLLRRRR